MGSVKSHLLNQVLQAVWVVLAVASTGFIYPLVGPEAYGIFNSLAAAAALSFILDGNYFINGFQIDFKRDENPDLYSSVLLLVVGCCLLQIIVNFLLCLFLTPYDWSNCLVYALLLSYLPLRSFFGAYLQIVDKIALNQVFRIIGRAVSVGAVAVAYFVFEWRGVDLVILLGAVDLILSMILQGSYIFKNQRFGKISKKLIKENFKYASPLLSSSIISGIFFHSVRISIANLLPVAQFGRLSLINSVMEYLQGFTKIYTAQQFPGMIKRIHKEGFWAAAKVEFKELSKVVAVFGAIGTVALVFLDMILDFEVFSRLKEIKEYLYVVCYFSLFRIYFGLANQLVIAARENKLQAGVSLISQPLQYFLALLLTYYWQFEGALAALMMNSVLTGILMFIAAGVKYKRLSLKIK